MNELKQWIEQERKAGSVEPNGTLGKAYSYILRHWRELTQFLRLEGCPVDNNLCERTLKLVVLNRKNSLFYRGGEWSECW